MKHAVLIIAHKNKEQLIRLIRSLASDAFDFFVHLDAEWNLSKSELEEIQNCEKNVFLAKKRLHGVLDHWSLPQIELNLIDEALEHGGGIHTFCFSQDRIIQLRAKNI